MKRHTLERVLDNEESEGLYHLPKSWVWTKLEEVCLDPQYGWTTSAENEGKLHLLRTTDITSGKIDWASVPFCKEEPPEKEKYLLEDGDIVISRAGSVGYNHLIKNPKEAIFASYLIRFRPLINEQYLSYFLKSPSYWKSISEKSLGIAIPNVNATKLKQIPLPPLPEQHRIVAKIEELFTELDAGVEALKKVKTQLKRYRQAVLKYAFEGKLTEKWMERHKGKIEDASVLLERIKKELSLRGVERRSKLKDKNEIASPSARNDNLPLLPEGWVWTRVGEIANKIQYGTSEKSNADSSGLPVLRMGNIQDGKLIFKDLKYFPKNWPQLKDFLLQDGDVLFNRTNSAGIITGVFIH